MGRGWRIYVKRRKDGSLTLKSCCIVWYLFSALHIMLLPGQKPAKAFFFLFADVFVHVTRQFRHSLVVHSILRKTLDPPLKQYNRLIWQQDGNVSWRRESARRRLNTTSGAQFSPLPLVKPDVLFARTVVNWRSRSVAKSAYYIKRYTQQKCLKNCHN